MHPPEDSHQPYFYARVEDRNVHAKGLNACSLGHTIKRQSAPPDGIFANWSWDGNRLTIENDRYGFYPLYYSYHKGEIGVSPSITKLIAEGASSEIDYDALSVFLRIGFFIGDDTPFKYIRCLPPAAAFTWHNGQLQVSGGYAWGSAQRFSREQAVDAYISLFRQSIKRRLPIDDNFTVPLSGGRDSRHILLELCEQGRPPRFCVTIPRYPPSTAEDVRVSALLASATGIEHVIAPQIESRFATEIRKNITTGFCTDEGAWLIALADYLQGRVHTAYDGIAGDVLSAGLFLKADLLNLFESKSYFELSDKLLEGGKLLNREDTLDHLLRSEQSQKVSRERAINHLTVELKKHSHLSNPVSSFYFWNRTRREIALSPYSVLNKAVPTIYSPYLDHDLFDFLTSLPTEMIIEHTFHTETIRRAYPKHADIPFDDKTAPWLDTRKHYDQFNKSLARYVFTRTRRPLRLLRSGYVLPRLAYSLVSQRYRESIRWLSPLLILYLFQLEALAMKEAKTR